MHKLLMAMVLWVGMAPALVAATVEERLVAGLQEQGYTVLEKGYTFLGRLRIVAENDLIHREIVVNPGTGEILRDYAIYLSDMTPAQIQMTDTDSRSGASKSGTTTRAMRPGTADVAASTLTPGTNTIGTSSLQLETRQSGRDLPLDDTILPMSPGDP